MSSLNKVEIIGRLGNDPEMRSLPNGEAVATLSVATSESWVDKISGERKEKTEWHRVVFYGGLAEVSGQYLKKGGLIYIEGKLVSIPLEQGNVFRLYWGARALCRKACQRHFPIFSHSFRVSYRFV